MRTFAKPRQVGNSYLACAYYRLFNTHVRRRLRMPISNLRHSLQWCLARSSRRRGVVALLCIILMTITLVPVKRFGTTTLVFRREDLQRIWLWEIASGHYPGRQNIPEQLRLGSIPNNPAVPPWRVPPPLGAFAVDAPGVGPKRTYLNIQNRPAHTEYPPRPVPGSIADLDVIMEHCDFARKKYVRDCLEMLRVGAGLDNGKHLSLRRGERDDWKYIYLEQATDDNTTHVAPAGVSAGESAHDTTDEGLVKKRGAKWETPPITLPPPRKRRPHSLHTCNPENPRLFHTFWTGLFTDKPYLTILAFLFTQNTGLHRLEYPESAPCRPQLWMWLNPGPGTPDVWDELRRNPWSAPFLHPRFKDLVQFKIWDTTEQLDSVSELNGWRSRETVRSDNRVVRVKAFRARMASPECGNETSGGAGGRSGGLDSRAVPESSSTYDRLSVILSDVARFILCHRFGGVYLDADVLVLRDWEELWGWNGAFAYRWSRLPRYNTAVLRLNKGSALGSFLLRTAFRNGLDFHPATISKYTAHAYTDNLLLRLPDALFDPAWLNVERYQRKRPPQPFFTDFSDFFNTPPGGGAPPQDLGFEGFFRGAYAYHFHNSWWRASDTARNWPDLGPRFITGEGAVRSADRVTDSPRDLPWSAVLKRTFEAYIRGDRPNMYGEWIQWDL